MKKKTDRERQIIRANKKGKKEFAKKKKRSFSQLTTGNKTKHQEYTPNILAMFTPKKKIKKQLSDDHKDKDKQRRAKKRKLSKKK